MVRVFGAADSRACHKAISWMEERGVYHQFVDMGNYPVDRIILKSWIHTFGWQSLIDKRTATWRGLPPDIKDTLSATTAGALMIRQPDMLKTPIVGIRGIWLLGWNAPNKVRLLGQIYHNRAVREHSGVNNKAARPDISIPG